MPTLTTRTEADLLRLARSAQAGDHQAVEELVGAIRDGVYNLSLRMLWHPHDAEDAAQEIMIKVLTGLGGFRGDSAFTTWAYAVASNHLLTTRRRRAEHAMSFEQFAADLADGLADPGDHGIDEDLLAAEVEIGCTQALLQCLDRDHRLAYVLGEVFELDSTKAAAVLAITPAAFRKRLQRSRARVVSFLEGHCGIVDPGRACRCRRRIDRAIELGRVDPASLHFATHPRRGGAVQAGVEEMHRLQSAAALLRSHPDYIAPLSVVDAITTLVRPTSYPLIVGPPESPDGESRRPSSRAE